MFIISSHLASTFLALFWQPISMLLNTSLGWTSLMRVQYRNIPIQFDLKMVNLSQQKSRFVLTFLFFSMCVEIHHFKKSQSVHLYLSQYWFMSKTYNTIFTGFLQLSLYATLRQWRNLVNCIILWIKLTDETKPLTLGLWWHSVQRPR